MIVLAAVEPATRARNAQPQPGATPAPRRTTDRSAARHATGAGHEHQSAGGQALDHAGEEGPGGGEELADRRGGARYGQQTEHGHDGRGDRGGQQTTMRRHVLCDQPAPRVPAEMADHSRSTCARVVCVWPTEMRTKRAPSICDEVT